MLDKRKFYINGNWVDPIKPNDLDVINPSTEETCAVISLATAIPKAAPLFEIKSSHKDKIVSKSFFFITFLLKSFSPASAMDEIICLKLNIGNDYHK